MNLSEFYDEVYSQEEQPPSRGWIQWKGTDVCIDLHCQCGHHGHYDGEFLYFYECPACHTKYAVGQNVKLIALNEAQVECLVKEHCDFKTGE